MTEKIVLAKHQRRKFERIAELEGEAITNVATNIQRPLLYGNYVRNTLRKLGWKSVSRIKKNDIASEYTATYINSFGCKCKLKKVLKSLDDINFK